MFGVERLGSLTTLIWDSTLDGASEIGEGRFDSFPQYCPTLAWAWMPAHSLYGVYLMTTSQIKSTVDFKDYKVWKMKDGIKATLVESDINTTVRLHDGSQKDIKADRYILIEWSPKLSLILEIPETHQKDPAAWVAKMNKAGQVDLRRGWGKVFPQAEQYDF